MVAMRGLTNHAHVHTPLWKSHLKHSTAEFQSISIFGCNWTSFHSKTKRKLKRKLKMLTYKSEGDMRRDQKPETFIFALAILCLIPWIQEVPNRYLCTMWAAIIIYLVWHRKLHLRQTNICKVGTIGHLSLIKFSQLNTPIWLYTFST